MSRSRKNQTRPADAHRTRLGRSDKRYDNKRFRHDARQALSQADNGDFDHLEELTRTSQRFGSRRSFEEE